MGDAVVFQGAHHIGGSTELIQATIGGMAVGDRLHHAEPILGNCLGQVLVQLEGVVDRGAGDVGGAGSNSQVADGEGRFDVAIGSGGGAPAQGSGGAVLPAGHAIDGVIDHQGGDAQVAPGGMDEVIAADGQGVAIAHDGNDLHVGTGDLQAGGKGQGTPMGGMEGVEIHVDRHAGRTADAGDQRHVVIIQTEVVDGANESAHDHADAAARAPDGGKFFVLAQFLEGLAEFEPIGLRDQIPSPASRVWASKMLSFAWLRPPSHPGPFAA